MSLSVLTPLSAAPAVPSSVLKLTHPLHPVFFTGAGGVGRGRSFSPRFQTLQFTCPHMHIQSLSALRPSPLSAAASSVTNVCIPLTSRRPKACLMRRGSCTWQPRVVVGKQSLLAGFPAQSGVYAPWCLVISPKQQLF